MLSVRLHIQSATPIMRGRDHYWATIRKVGAGGLFTVSEIFAQTSGTHRGTIWSFVQLLQRAGLVEKADNGSRRQAMRYRLLKAPVETPILGKDGIGQRGRLTRQMWNTMRGPTARSGFTVRDLVAYGSTEEQPVTARAAQQFIRQMHAAGYLAEVAGTKMFRLKPSMNSGPLPPAILSARIMFDRNRKQIVGETIAEEEAA